MNNQSKTLNTNDNTAQAQRQRLREYLFEHGKITTFEAQSKLDIVCPAARIFELRHEEDLNIITNWRIDASQTGNPHRIADYVLMTGKYSDLRSGDTEVINV